MKISHEPASSKLDKFKWQIVDTFYCWIKLRLPEQLFANLTADCPHILPLVFSELASDDADNVETAAKCIVELLQLSRNIELFSPIKNYIAANVDKLIANSAVAIQRQDVERAD